jgi:hypothetical protein
MQYILLSLVYFELELILFGDLHSFFSRAEGVGPSETGCLLPYLQRKYIRGFLCIVIIVFSIGEVGCKAYENYLQVRDFHGRGGLLAL